MNKIVLSLLLVAATSCGTKKCFTKTRVLVSSRTIEKLTDDYFKLRNKGYFTYYRRMLWFTKVEDYKGSYVLKADTLYLQFCGNIVPERLTGIGFINNKAKEITLYAKDTVFNRRFEIMTDKRKH